MISDRLKVKILAWINMLLFIVMIVVNYSGAAGLINDASQKEVSAMYNTFITPAGYAFAIWGVIYLLLFALLVQMIIRQKEADVALLVKEISLLIWLSAAFNIAWTISFSHLNMLLSLMFIATILLMLIIIAVKLATNRRFKKFKLASTAIGLYAGWLSVASFVNLAALTVQIRWNGFGLSRSVWGTITLFVALLLVTSVTLKIKNLAYLLSVIWAYIAIFVAYKSPDVFNIEYLHVQIALIIGILYLLTLAAGIIYRNVND